MHSTLDISKLIGLCFTSSNYPKCKLIMHFGEFGLVKKSQSPNYGWIKQSKCIFYSDRPSEFHRIRDPSSRYRDSIVVYKESKLTTGDRVLFRSVGQSSVLMKFLDFILDYRNFELLWWK